MSDETNKKSNREPVGPTAPMDAPQSADSDGGVSALPSGVPAAKDHEGQQDTGCDDACGQEGTSQNRPEDASNGNGPGSTPDGQAERDAVSSFSGEANNNIADQVDEDQVKGTPEMDDPFSVSYESEEEKEAIARLLASHHPYLISEESTEEVVGSEGPDPAAESTIWPEYEEYEPTPMIDLIRRSGEIEVARIEWRGVHPTVTVVSDRYSIPSMPSAVYNSVRLPNDVADYESARKMFGAVVDVLRNCSALSQPQCELLSFWSVASWFQDSLDHLPRITVSGPRYAADLLFTLLTYVCHRAIKLIDINSAVLEAMSVEQLRPTLLIHQVNARKSTSQLLDATDYPGYIFAGARELRQHCCGKVLYVGETYSSKQSISGLHIHLARNAPVPMRPYLSSGAIDQLQSRLLAYRAFNRERIDFFEVSSGKLQPEFDVIARRLGAVIVNDSALQRRLIELLKGWSEDKRSERASGIEATVLTAVLILAHSNELQCYVRKITAVANQLMIEQGEASKLTCGKIGHVLRRLGLHTHRDMKGRALVLDRSTQLLVHELCFEYGVLPTSPECGYCHKPQTLEGD
jgi:hypothetical protein